MEEFQAVADKLPPFVRRMLESEPRFRFHAVGNDVYHDAQIFVATKKVIHIPYSLPTAEHEIAHAVEMKNQARWLLPDWGLAFGIKNWEINLTPSGFFSSMAREIRVRAIEILINPPHRADTMSTRYNILNNKFAWGGDCTKRFLPYGRFRKYEDVESWVHDLREKTWKAWSLARIEHEWMIRLAHIQNWMETS